AEAGQACHSAGPRVQQLKELVRGELDLLVPPLGRAVVAGDDPRAVDPAEVAVDEGVTRLPPVVRTLRQPEVPLRVLLPGVVREVGVLGVGLRLHAAPLAVQHVLARLDQLAGTGDGPLVDRVARHRRYLRRPQIVLTRPPSITKLAP